VVVAKKSKKSVGGKKKPKPQIALPPDFNPDHGGGGVRSFMLFSLGHVGGAGRRKKKRAMRRKKGRL
jgi:hypothetical protein